MRPSVITPRTPRQGFDNGVACCHAFLGRVLWHLGLPPTRVWFTQKLRSACRAPSLTRTANPWALSWAAALYQLRGEAAACHERAEAALTIANGAGSSGFGAPGMVLGGWALAKQERTEEGLARLRSGINALSRNRRQNRRDSLADAPRRDLSRNWPDRGSAVHAAPGVRRD